MSRKVMALKELQQFELGILKDVHNFCVSNNIVYTLSDGTLLGAVRHKGFIPWDDDIDIIMPRPDYERFLKFYHSDRYVLVHHGNEKTCYLAFARVCDNKETLAESTKPWCKRDFGVWIDIFPADGAPMDPDKLKKLYADCLETRRNVWQYRKIQRKITRDMPLCEAFGLLKAKIATRNGRKGIYYTERLIEAMQQYEFGKHEYWASLSNVHGMDDRKHHEIETFKHCSLMDFEDTKFYVLDGYDRYLTNYFGDYMTPPPVEEQVPKQSYITFYWKK